MYLKIFSRITSYLALAKRFTTLSWIGNAIVSIVRSGSMSNALAIQWSRKHILIPVIHMAKMSPNCCLQYLSVEVQMVWRIEMLSGMWLEQGDDSKSSKNGSRTKLYQMSGKLFWVPPLFRKC
jgi:hypothetical protein